MWSTAIVAVEKPGKSELQVYRNKLTESDSVIMPGCVLRANGKTFQVDQFLKDSSLTPHVIYRQGEPRSVKGETKHKASGFNVIVSKASGKQVKKQFKDTLSFLKKHQAELERLKLFAGVDSLCLDYGVELRIGYDDCFWPGISIPEPVIQLAANSGLEIRFSFYPDVHPEFTKITS